MGFLYIESSLSPFWFAAIFSESKQSLALTLTFLTSATGSVAPMNLFIKSEYAAFVQVHFKYSGKLIFVVFLESFLVCNVSLTGQVFPYDYEILVVMFFVWKK